MKELGLSSALLISALLHAGFWGVSAFSPAPVQYPVQQALSSVDVLLIEEPALKKEDLIVPEEVMTTPVQEELAQAPLPELVEKKEEPVIEPEPSVGAVMEAQPLEFVNPAPVYPYLARKRGWEGVAVIQVRVEKDGLPSLVEVLQSSGHSILDEEALKTIRQWRFKPAQSSMMVFSSTVNIPVRFQLVDEK